MPSKLSRIPDELPPRATGSPNERVRSAADVVAEYQSLFNEDFMAARDRASVQAMVDGNTPFSEARLRLMGIHGITNVNWGDLTQAQQEAEQPYNDILESMDSFGLVPVKAGILTEAEAVIQEPVIADELFRMITGWEDFHFNWLLLSHYFTMFGVGFTYRDDQIDWRWKVGSLQEFKIPRGIRASISKADRITMKCDMQPSDLMGKVRDRAAGEKLGWNYDAIVKSCNNACPTPLNTADPESTQQMWKDNGIASGNTTVVVTVVHMWVKELDGTISHYIADYNGANYSANDFIYKCRHKYGSMYEFVNSYLFAVGTNGDLHSIRGNAWNLFSSTAALNKLKSKLIDKANDEANTFLSTESEDATIDNMLVPRGPYYQLSTGVTFVERETPPVAHSLIPAIQLIDQVFSKRSGGMAPRTTSVGDTGQKTKYELQRRDEMDSKLTSSSMNLFFASWGRDYKEIVRRVSNPDLQENHPGGAEVFEFRRRCIERGVRPEALTNLDYKRINLNMGVGKGSEAERRAVLTTLNEQVMPRLDAAGQTILTRDTVAAYAGRRYANILVPPQQGQRPPMDQQIANLENSLFALGSASQVEPNQDHEVHVADHLGLLQSLNQQIASAAAELQDVIPQMQMVSEHCLEHMQYISPEVEMYPMFKEALQQFNEVITNGAKHIEAEERRAAKAAAKGEAAPDTAGTPAGVFGQAVDASARTQELLSTSNAKISIMQREANEKMRIAAEKAAQDRAIADAKAAQQIKHIAAKNRRAAVKSK